MGGAPGGSGDGEAGWLTLGQAARFLGVAQSTVRKWSDAGRLAAFYTPGGHRRFREDDLAAFIARSRNTPPRPDASVVLVVGGDALRRGLVRARLELAGYAAREAEDADEALAAAELGSPHLVLLDVVMPGLDGWQLLRRLEERHGSIPVIVFSSGAGEGSAETPEAGAHGFSGKPFDPDELVERTRRLLPG